MLPTPLSTGFGLLFILMGVAGVWLIFDASTTATSSARRYSISSSPTQTGFGEITVKKRSQGCVSSFLNEWASMSLTVGAVRPSGRFSFDENEHKSIVLFAAGSGIIDDLCLDINVNLLLELLARNGASSYQDGSGRRPRSGFECARLRAGICGTAQGNV